MKTVIRWFLNALALLITAMLIGGIHVTGFWPAFISAALLGIVNAFIRPVFIILTLPINIITLGLFTFIINGIMLLMVSYVVRGFIISGLFSAVLGSIILTIISSILTSLVKK